jgi:hypothetical protein
VFRKQARGGEPYSPRARRTGNDGSLAFKKHRFLQDKFFVFGFVGRSMSRAEPSDKRNVYTPC